SSSVRPLVFHFPDPGLRYTRATPTLRRPTACQRSSVVIAVLIGPAPRRAARVAGLRAGAPAPRTLSASASPSGARAWSSAAYPTPLSRLPARDGSREPS